MSRTLRARRGIALLEVLAAFALVATAGIALLGFARQSAAAVELGTQRELELRRAALLLHRYTLLSATELAAKSGQRPEQGFEVRICSNDRRLFNVAILDPASASPILSTTVYPRRRRADASP
jgi:type II secretory pathway component PulJ